jgi:hypothetical protein
MSNTIFFRGRVREVSNMTLHELKQAEGQLNTSIKNAKDERIFKGDIAELKLVTTEIAKIEREEAEAERAFNKAHPELNP